MLPAKALRSNQVLVAAESAIGNQVSHIEPGRTVRGEIVQLQIINFRLNGKPVRVKFLTAPNITDGDHVVACGVGNGGELDAEAINFQFRSAQ